MKKTPMNSISPRLDRYDIKCMKKSRQVKKLAIYNKINNFETIKLIFWQNKVLRKEYFHQIS